MSTTGKYTGPSSPLTNQPERAPERTNDRLARKEVPRRRRDTQGQPSHPLTPNIAPRPLVNPNGSESEYSQEGVDSRIPEPTRQSAYAQVQVPTSAALSNPSQIHRKVVATTQRREREMQTASPTDSIEMFERTSRRQPASPVRSDRDSRDIDVESQVGTNINVDNLDEVNKFVEDYREATKWARRIDLFTGVASTAGMVTMGIIVSAVAASGPFGLLAAVGTWAAVSLAGAFFQNSQRNKAAAKFPGGMQTLRDIASQQGEEFATARKQAQKLVDLQERSVGGTFLRSFLSPGRLVIKGAIRAWNYFQQEKATIDTATRPNTQSNTRNTSTRTRESRRQVERARSNTPESERDEHLSDVAADENDNRLRFADDDEEDFNVRVYAARTPTPEGLGDELIYDGDGEDEDEGDEPFGQTGLEPLPHDLDELPPAMVVDDEIDNTRHYVPGSDVPLTARQIMDKNKDLAKVTDADLAPARPKTTRGKSVAFSADKPERFEWDNSTPPESPMEETTPITAAFSSHPNPFVQTNGRAVLPLETLLKQSRADNGSSLEGSDDEFALRSVAQFNQERRPPPKSASYLAGERAAANAWRTSNLPDDFDVSRFAKKPLPKVAPLRTAKAENYDSDSSATRTRRKFEGQKGLLSLSLVDKKQTAAQPGPVQAGETHMQAMLEEIDAFTDFMPSGASLDKPRYRPSRLPVATSRTKQPVANTQPVVSAQPIANTQPVQSVTVLKPSLRDADGSISRRMLAQVFSLGDRDTSTVPFGEAFAEMHRKVHGYTRHAASLRPNEVDAVRQVRSRVAPLLEKSQVWAEQLDSVFAAFADESNGSLSLRRTALQATLVMLAEDMRTTLAKTGEVLIPGSIAGMQQGQQIAQGVLYHIKRGADGEFGVSLYNTNRGIERHTELEDGSFAPAYTVGQVPTIDVRAIVDLLSLGARHGFLPDDETNPNSLGVHVRTAYRTVRNLGKVQSPSMPASRGVRPNETDNGAWAVLDNFVAAQLGERESNQFRAYFQSRFLKDGQEKWDVPDLERGLVEFENAVRSGQTLGERKLFGLSTLAEANKVWAATHEKLWNNEGIHMYRSARQYATETAIRNPNKK